MERLTTRCSGYAVMAWEHEEKHTTEEWIDMLTDRLAAYEDTGLEPEEIERIVDAYGRGHTLRTESAERLEIVREIKTDRIRELVQAEQAGRLVVLPCKVGDTIYYTREGCPIVEPLKVRTFFVGDPTRRGEILHLHMIRTDKFDVSMDALGKTVFLTREEAEAALAQEGGKDHA